MSIKESLKESSQRERQKIRELPGIAKKIEYIWEYYHYWIIGIAIAIAFCWSIGSSVYRNIKYTQIFYCAIFNNSLPDEYLDEMENGFSDYYGLDPESETMHFDASYILSESDSETTYMTVQKIGAMIASKSVDVMMGDEFTMEQYATDGYFYDLSEILPSETYDALEDYMVEFTYTEDDVTITAPFMIDLTQSELVKNGVIYVEDPLAGIVINSQNPLVAVEYIEYIFGL